MNNYQIEKILRSRFDTRSTFVSVHSIDTLPELPRSRRPCSYVSNTASQYEDGEHWVAYYFPLRGIGEYFDSFGMDPSKESKRFLGNKYKQNTRFIQNPFTTVCGQYVVLYIWMRSNNFSMTDIVRIFSHEDKDHIDIFVNKCVEILFGTDLNVQDVEFLYSQIARSYNDITYKK